MTRIDVNFEVQQQQMVWIKDQPLRAKDENYFYAVFKLCDKWKNVAGIKAAFFRDNNLPYLVDLTESSIIDGCLECIIPWEVMVEKGEFYVGVFGGDRILTNKVRVDVGESCYCGGGQESAPTFDWFRDVEEKLEELSNTANPLPTGGNPGQILVKDTADDYAVKWEDAKDYTEDINAINDNIKAAEQTIIELDDTKADKTEIPTKVSAFENDKNYATEAYVDGAVSNIDLSGYALKEEIPSTTGLASETYVDNAVKGVQDNLTNNYPTKEYVDNAVANVQVDLTGYATEEYVDNAIAAIPKTDLSNYATKQEVSEAIANIDIPETDLTNYYTKPEVDNALSNKANKDEIPTVPTKVSAFENDAGYLTTHQSLDNYYTKAQVDTAISNVEVDLSGYYTKAQVDAIVGDINILLDEINGEYPEALALADEINGEVI